jgi:hypothetical protein
LGTNRIIHRICIFSLFLAAVEISEGSQASHAVQLGQFPASSESQSGPVTDDYFLNGCLKLNNGDLQKAREFFTNYLKGNQVRAYSDIHLANLIGLGLACEGLGDYRFAEGYFKLSAGICLYQWYLVDSPYECNFFYGRLYGLRRMEPFEGLLRLAVRENDIAGGFSWSEKIHFLKMVGRAVCPGKETGHESLRPGGGRRGEARAAFTAVLNQMQAALERQDRPLFLKLAVRFQELGQQYPDYAKEVYLNPLSAGSLPLKPEEALLEFLVTDHKTYAWAVHNRRIIKNVVIPLGRGDLEVKVNRYLSSAGNGSTSTQTAQYDSELGMELYALLLKDLLLPLPPVARVVIIPDDGLWELPFESLIRQAAEEDIAGKPGGQKLRWDAPAVTYYQAATPLPASLQKPK